jgi:excisionase family DNA binding protein
VTRQKATPPPVGLSLDELRAAIGNRIFTTVPVVAQLLDLDERTVRRGIERGELPGIRVGSSIRIPVAELLRLARLDEAQDSNVPEPQGPGTTSTSTPPQRLVSRNDAPVLG